MLSRLQCRGVPRTIEYVNAIRAGGSINVYMPSIVFSAATADLGTGYETYQSFMCPLSEKMKEYITYKYLRNEGVTAPRSVHT
jgi:hypothetical protein